MTLDPEFDPDEDEYTATTSNDSDAITATAAEGCTVTIESDDATISDEGVATWAEGDNVVTITVSAEGYPDGVYTVTVTKS